MEVCFEIKNVTKKDYNFITSNLVLSQEREFIYDDMVNQLNTMFGCINEDLEDALKESLLRLREDGFLSVLGSKYKIVPLKI